MKKIFLFAAAIVAAMSINAEQILFTEVVAKGALNGESVSDGELVLSVTDEAGKVEVDANNCLFGDANSQIKFTHRLKTGGKSQVKEGATNALRLTVPRNGKLYVYARTGKNSETTRNIVLTQEGATLLDHILLESEAIEVTGLDKDDPTKASNVYSPLVVDVQEGDIDITYPNGSINIYGFSFDAPLQPQGFEEIFASPKATKMVYQGQVVIVKDGRMFNLLGSEIAR